MDLYQQTKLMEVIKEVHSQHADDVCWMDIDKIFKAAGLTTPERRVGDKAAMLYNCQRFIITMCQSGQWKSYVELEAEIVTLKSTMKSVAQKLKEWSIKDGSKCMDSFAEELTEAIK